MLQTQFFLFPGLLPRDLSRPPSHTSISALHVRGSFQYNLSHNNLCAFLRRAARRYCAVADAGIPSSCCRYVLSTQGLSLAICNMSDTVSNSKTPPLRVITCAAIQLFFAALLFCFQMVLTSSRIDVGLNMGPRGAAFGGDYDEEALLNMRPSICAVVR